MLIWDGIVCARLTDYAGALNVEPQAILDAVEANEISPAVDTAEPKGRSRSGSERPTEPELCCLAFSRQDFARLVAAVAPEKGSTEEGGRPAAVGA